MTQEATPEGEQAAGQVCYRHRDRETYVRCVRCNRPICPDCMTAAAVGFQCPECVREGNRSIRPTRTTFGGRVSGRENAVTIGLIGINVAVFLLAAATNPAALTRAVPTTLHDRFALYGLGVAQGEYYRLITSAFLHYGPLHIAFNMYALWLFGPIIEQMYGHVEFGVIYLLCALGGNVLTILAAPNVPALGASGAIFGLFGLAFIVSRRRHLLLGPQARAMLSRVGTLLVLNLIITFSLPFISWTGHVGGLVVGAVIGVLLAPGNVPTMGGVWRAPDGSLMARRISPSLRASTYLLVAAVLVLGTYVAIQQLG